MTGRPLLSTTLLTHNRVPLTRRTIEAYQRSTKVPYELIVVDNASTDGTRAYLQALAQRDPRVKLIFNDQNLPVGQAVNLGFARAQGDYLQRMDNDVIHKEGWDYRVLQVFERFPLMGQVCPVKVLMDYLTQVHPLDANFAIAFSVENVTGSSNVIRRELWDQGLRHREEAWSPGGIGEDYWFSQDVAAMGYDFSWFATDEYCYNSGHNPQEMTEYVDYYIRTYANRGNLPLLAQRLARAGFDLEKYMKEKGMRHSLGAEVNRRFHHAISNARLKYRIWLDGLASDKLYRPKPSNKLRISAVIPTYNEADVIYWTIRYLVDQGIHVHVLDNESTDATLRIANSFPRSDVSFSTFRTGGEFNEGIQGQAIQEALHHLGKRSDWVIKNDADEFLEAPFAGMRLRTGIELADRLGANCIGIRSFTFFPMSDEAPHVPGQDIRSAYDHFKVWDQTDNYPSSLHPQHNELWKINMYKSRGGVAYYNPHLVSPFGNINVFPDLFILRHYPYRAPERTSQRLLLERRDRMSSWNVRNDLSCHYGRFSERDTFIFDHMRGEMRRWSRFVKPAFKNG